MSRVTAVLPTLLLLAAAPAAAQEGAGLRSLVYDLFRFADCPQPLCLTVADPNRQDDFIVSAAQTNAPLIDFIGRAIGVSVASVPLSSASSGVFFTFEGGLPVRQELSTGPIFAERAQTLGSGRFLVGGNVSGIAFNSLRGVPLDGITFNFTHQNVGAGALGDPEFENDFVTVDLDLDVNLYIAQLFFVYGVLDRLDIGLSVPLVQTSLSGTSTGRIIPYGADSPHYFGTAGNPSLTATSSIDGSATGIGDMAVRAKLNLTRNPERAFALLADVRIPTGSEEDLLGAGSLAVRGLGIYSARLGNFTPHVNAGFMGTADQDRSNAVLAAAGFDQLVAPWATFAFDLMGQLQVGGSPLVLPSPVQITEPLPRTIQPSNLPDISDHMLDASFGFRFNAASGLRGLVNALVPLNDGGMRANVMWTIGLEYSGAGLLGR